MQNILTKIGVFIGGLLITAGSWLSPATLGYVNPVQAQKTTLSGAGITAIQTSIPLNSLLASDNATPLTMTMFGSVVYGTIDPGVPKKEENVSCTGITQNLNGSASLTGCSRGLLPFSPYTPSSTWAYTHSGGATLALSNSSAFYNGLFAFYQNTTTITGLWTFASSSLPNVTTDTTNVQVASNIYNLSTVAYANSLAIAGAPAMSNTISGIALQATTTQLQNSTNASGTYPYVVGVSSVASTSRANSIPLTNASGTLDPSFVSGTAYTFTNPTLVNANLTGSTTGMLFPYGGDGSDGATTTAATTTLSRDMYYTNLTVATGTTLYPNGYRIYVSGTLTVNGTISVSGTNGGNGANAVTTTFGNGGTAGTSTPAGSLPAGNPGSAGSNGGADICITPAGCGAGGGGGGAGGSGGIASIYAKIIIVGSSGSIQSNGGNGGNGGNGTVGSGSNGGGSNGGGSSSSSNGTSTTNSIGVAGSIGGQGGNGTNSGATGATPGTAGTVTTSTYLPHTALYAINMWSPTTGNTTTIALYQPSAGSTGGTGGGGSGADAGSNTGYGGGGGGTGAGGSGGAIILVYSSLTNNGSITATAGLAGTVVGLQGRGTNGSLGTNGKAGTIYQIQVL